MEIEKKKKTAWERVSLARKLERPKALDSVSYTHLFHLPQSTLLMLVSALAGKDYIMEAYKEAVKEKYRFFSFGDAMFIK